MPVLAAGLLSPNTGLIFWTILVFGLLLFVLGKFAWGPITKALAERETTIDASIQQAERALAEAKQLQANNEQARRDADADARRVQAEAREAAERYRAEAFEKAKADAAAIVEQGRQEIEREKLAALQQIRAEVADLAIASAEKILRKEIDTPAQRQMVDRFLDTLPAQQN